jgi:Ca2+-binding RTX toxin-like protein
VLIGNAGVNTLHGRGGKVQLLGGDGNDVYVVNSADDVVTELAGQGIDLVRSEVSYALGANLENLILLGAAHINGMGNGLSNALTGNTGNNLLNGGAEADTMSGGLGNDTYVVDNADDTVSEAADEGTDTVQSSVDYVLGDDVENLTLIGAASINGTGNALVNELVGNTGNNVLDGGAGADSMSGGLGNDTYVVDDAGDTVIEGLIGGTDTVQSTVGFSLAGLGVENLTLAGVDDIDGTGNGMSNVLIGNAGANVLSGGAGNDTLDGGAGADDLIGGLGNDTYVVDDAGDTVTEGSNDGTDTVQSWVTFFLGASFERLTLLGTDNIDAWGNEQDNILIGNSGDNELHGGPGSDSMIGGLGDDVYVVNGAGAGPAPWVSNDIVVELANQGTDTVRSLVSYALGANVENLTLFGDHINGTGNNLDNVLTGSSGNNVLSGGGGNDTLDGGLGVNVLQGGAGDDTYMVGLASDTVTELAGQGSDTVISALFSYTLGANLENLTISFGSGNATGNALNNVLTGATGHNWLNGAAGNDILTGGDQEDAFIFDSVLNATTNVDTITDFAVSGASEDHFRLSHAIFGQIDAGGLTADAFCVGSAATTVNHRIVYNDVTGAISYDADGNGAGAAVMFAAVTAGTALEHDHFLII